MAEIIEFPTSDEDTVILVEVDRAPGDGVRPVADTDIAGRASKSFEQSVSGLAPITNAILTAITKIDRAPSEITVEMGFKISAKGSLILCSTEGEVNFKAAVKWSAPKPVAAADAPKS